MTGHITKRSAERRQWRFISASLDNANYENDNYIIEARKSRTQIFMNHYGGL